MTKSTIKYLLVFLLGVLISGNTVYEHMKTDTDNVKMPGLSFAVPFIVYDGISENFVFRFTDKPSVPDSSPNMKRITVPDTPDIMTEEQFSDVAAGNFATSVESGYMSFDDITAKYYRSTDVLLGYIAFVRDSKTGRTWQFTFDNLDDTDVFYVLRSIKVTDN